RRTNRKRKAKLKADVQHQTPDHQMVLRQTDDLDFDGVNSSYTEISPMMKYAGINPSTVLVAQSKGVPGNVQSVPVNVRSLTVMEKERTVAKQTVKDLSVQTTVKTVLRDQLGTNLDVEWSSEDVAIGVDGVEKQEGVYWNWRRRKKPRKMV
ncbi:MAG: hypothetical protein GY820_47725, partial [Gammaproteobacteria bacterium]|nr:hypothetical protein [Gammaproteobacteria bacterium]